MSHSIWIGNPYYQLLSLAIIGYASYMMFSIIEFINQHAKPRHLQALLKWGAAASVIYGLGLWTMHVVSLLSSDYLMVLDWSVLAVYAAGSSVTFGGLYLYCRAPDTGGRDWIAALLLSAASLIFHYMSVLTHSYHDFSIRFGLFGLSFTVIFAGAYMSLTLIRRNASRYKIWSSAILGLSALLMHYLGMSAVTIEYSAVLTTESVNSYLLLLALVLFVTSFLIITFSLTTWSNTRKYAVIDEKYKLLVENSMDTIALIKDGKWEYINPSGLKLFEAEHEYDLIGLPICSMLHEKHRGEMSDWLEAASGNGPDPDKPVELQWITLRGKLLHTEMVRARGDMFGTPIEQVIIRDISERKKNEELLINSEKLSIAGQLAAGIAHEIRNPLTSLKGFMQLIATGRVKGNRYHSIIQSELLRIESIVSELLMLSKPQMHEYAYIDMRSLMEDIVALLETESLLHNIHMEYRYPKHPMWVMGVESQLKQVFINLLKNAIESMQNGGEVKIDMALDDGEAVVIRIQDEGAGIPEEQLSKIGQPFYTTKDKGTGLGLMVSYKIIDNHQGAIAAESEMGVGTTFTVSLPHRCPAAGQLAKINRHA